MSWSFLSFYFLLVLSGNMADNKKNNKDEGSQLVRSLLCKKVFKRNMKNNHDPIIWIVIHPEKIVI